MGHRTHPIAADLLLLTKRFESNNPWENDDPAASTEVAKPHVSAETAADDVDWMILMTLYCHEAIVYISAAMDRAGAVGQSHYLEAKEKAVVGMSSKYRDVIEAEKRKVKDEDLRKEPGRKRTRHRQGVQKIITSYVQMGEKTSFTIHILYICRDNQDKSRRRENCTPLLLVFTSPTSTETPALLRAYA